MCARYTLTKDGFVIQIGKYVIMIYVTARYNIALAQKAAVNRPSPTHNPLPTLNCH
jgi:hypothetical protein